MCLFTLACGWGGGGSQFGRLDKNLSTLSILSAPSPHRFLCWGGQAILKVLNLVTYTLSVAVLHIRVSNTTHHSPPHPLVKGGGGWNWKLCRWAYPWSKFQGKITNVLYWSLSSYMRVPMSMAAPDLLTRHVKGTVSRDGFGFCWHVV